MEKLVKNTGEDAVSPADNCTYKCTCIGGSGQFSNSMNQGAFWWARPTSTF